MASFFNYSQLVMLLTILSVSDVIGNVQVLKYMQKLDHFGRERQLSNHTFSQTLVVDHSEWAGAKARAPIVVLLGEFYAEKVDPNKLGIFSLTAPEFKAMLVVIEHRFYGTSIPLGSIDLALADQKIRACLTIEQTLEDFNVIISSLKFNYSAHHSPVIVMGRSYGGALATWFRLKFPQMTVGALASSAPLLYYGTSSPGDGYCDVVSNDFKDANPTCYGTIRRSWQIIDDYASEPNGLENLSKTFKSCRPIRSADEVKVPLAILYSEFAQSDEPTNHDTKSICEDLSTEDFSIEVLSSTLHHYMVNGDCFNNTNTFITDFDTPFQLQHVNVRSSAWEWQRCSELIFPVGCARKTMLPSRPFAMAQFEQLCQENFGIAPHSNLLSNYYGNYSIEDYLTKFGRNIILSNGLRDPYSSGAILKDLSNSITAIAPTNGGNCWDFSDGSDDDPKWLKESREQELKILRRWSKESDHNSKSSNRGASNFTIHFVELLILIFIIIIVIF